MMILMAPFQLGERGASRRMYTWFTWKPECKRFSFPCPHQRPVDATWKGGQSYEVWVILETGSSWVCITLQEFSSHEVCYRVSCIADLSVSFVGEVWGKCKPFICFLTLLSSVAVWQKQVQHVLHKSDKIWKSLFFISFGFCERRSGLTVIELSSRSRGAVGSLCCISSKKLDFHSASLHPRE